MAFMAKPNDRDFPPLPSSTRSSQKRKHSNSISDTKTASKPASLNDLPEELLLSILHYLPGINSESFGLRSLVALSSTNRRFHRLVEEELYSAYDCRFCDPYLFLRTIVTQPCLAESVKTVSLSLERWDRVIQKPYSPTAQDKKIVKEGFRKLGIPNWKGWATDCNTNLASLHAAILMQTNNATALSIREYSDDSAPSETPKWIDLLRRANDGIHLGSMHRFQHLSSLRVDMSEITLRQLAPALRTPSLRYLHLNNVLEFDGAATAVLQRVLPQRCNGLKSILLEQSFLSTDILRIVVASSKGLRCLRYESNLDFPVIVPGDGLYLISPERLMAVLDCQKLSLEELHLTGLHETQTYRGWTVSDHVDFRMFAALRLVNLPLLLLVASGLVSTSMPREMCPPALVALHTRIRNISYPKCLQELEAVTSTWSTYSTCLEEIRINVVDPGPWFLHDWTSLALACSRAGINLVVEESHEDTDGFEESWEGGNAASETSSDESDEISLYSD